MNDVIGWVMQNGVALIQAVLMVLGGFSIIAKFTPTKKDDAVIDAILKVIHTLGLTKKNG